MRVRWLTSLALVLAVAGAGAWFWLVRFGTWLDQPLTLPPGEVRIIVRPGERLSEVGREAARRGWLTRSAYLTLWGRWTGQATRIKAGEFRIPPGATPRRLLRILVIGRPVQHTITFLEGWTFAQVVTAVQSHPAIRITLPTEKPPADLGFLGEPGVAPEGYLMPDTYHFERGSTDVDLLARAHRAMRRFLAEEWPKRAAHLPVSTPYQALILASIVEKETGRDEERARIAGVFTRRLQRGMRLETDPTVIYGIGPEFDGNLTRRHLGEPTPYNTYLIEGLPPTPIALPGRASVLAALHPAPGEAMFFVSKGDGGHYFSKSYEEHRRAVGRYQRHPHARGRISRPSGRH